MDINNLNSNPLLDRRNRELTAEDPRTGKQGPASASGQVGEGHSPAELAGARSQDGKTGDQVTLSAEARTLRRLESRVAEADGFDGDRVERIRAAIAEGRYHVDADRLADKFIELENLLDQ